MLRQTLLIRKYLPSASLRAQTLPAVRRGYRMPPCPHPCLHPCPHHCPRRCSQPGGAQRRATPRQKRGLLRRPPPLCPSPLGPGVAGSPGVRRDEPPSSRPPVAPLLPRGAASGRGACGVKRVHSTQTPRKNAWINYAEGFLDFFQVIKFRFLAFILVPGSTRRHGRQKSSLIVPGFKFDFVT